MTPDPNADPVDVHVGNVIRAKRRLRGLSQQALAETAKVTFQQIQKYERGANRVSSSMLWRIAGALKSPITDFFPVQDPAGLVQGLGPADKLAGVIGGLELAEHYLALDPRRREAARNIVEALRSTMEGEEPGEAYVSGGDREGKPRVAA